MPKIEASVTCDIDDVDLKAVSNALSSAIQAITGSPCRVLLNRTNKGMGKMDIYTTRSQMKHNNIELMDRLNR